MGLYSPKFAQFVKCQEILKGNEIAISIGRDLVPDIIDSGPKKLFNTSTWRKSGLASNPLFILPGFFLHFSLELSYGYLWFEGNGKIPLGR